MRSGTHIVLVVTGSIAAYKSAELIRELVREGMKVSVVMTAAAEKFISPMTMQVLSHRKVTTDLFDCDTELEIGHIGLADSADVVLVAPASADFIARVAAGMADDAASAVVLATRAPVIIAPAMNVNMWENPATQENIQRLEDRGIYFVDPEAGDLACGWQGIGRLADNSTILTALHYVTAGKDLVGSHVIVAAGPTQEAVDKLQYIGSRVSGALGYAVARAAFSRGARVSLVTGPTELKPPYGVDVFSVETALEMRQKMFELFDSITSTPQESDIYTKGGKGTTLVFMAASVSRFRAVEVEDRLTIVEGENKSIKLVPNPDILLELGKKRTEIESISKSRIRLVGFSSSVGDEDELLAQAREKLTRKGADVMVGNSAASENLDVAERVWLVDRQGRQEEASASDKAQLADKIISSALKV